MGDCLSVQKRKDPTMELNCSISSQKDKVQIQSPIKGRAIDGEEHLMDAVNSKPQSSPLPYRDSFKDLTNNDELYFDSQAWIDSDNEDFVSLNGDSTPSYEKTPAKQSSLPGNTLSERSVIVNKTPNSSPEPSPTDMKKQLFEFFHEKSSDDDSDNADQSFKVAVDAKPIITCSFSPKSTNPSRCGSLANSSVCNFRTTSNRGSNTGKVKSTQSSQCCLSIPNLVRSLSERKKRQT
ncbi:hypothetical protein HS088_TW22G00358 [Tripterygium wilfordii]|uniref:Uncharacterized protein n=1 Tax=Tripterygium wilfordii TaxID=458696 RepID=A0A7J7BYH9_TRIWF|nr:uncharacterized protein At3g27210-like [Tripterygium wilfordii]KAF5726677.1 hypothetical protein HS088_TW22G00358 [Tripterygium wilfordii]